jgi:cytochrome bd ubiquinol oxidase subunit II
VIFQSQLSPAYTLKVMTVIAVIFLPVVIVYQSWAYHILKKRLSVPRVGGDEDEAAPTAAGTKTLAATD